MIETAQYQSNGDEGVTPDGACVLCAGCSACEACRACAWCATCGPTNPLSDIDGAGWAYAVGLALF